MINERVMVNERVYKLKHKHLNFNWKASFHQRFDESTGIFFKLIS